MPTFRQPNLRLATESDVSAITELHTLSWQATYRGQFPDDYLENQAPIDIAETWTDRFKDHSGTLTIVATLDDTVSGFSHVVIDKDPEWGTLLDNLHVHPEMKGTGIGRALMAETSRQLLASATTPRMHLWVLEANHRARRFYDALGGETTASLVDDVHHGIELPVLRYSWPDVSKLQTAR